MGVQRLLQQQAPLKQLREDGGVRLLDEHIGPGRSLHKAAFGVDQLHKGQAFASADAGVILTKGGGNVHNAGAVRQGNIVIRHYVPGFFRVVAQVPQRLIGHAQKGLPLHEGLVLHLGALLFRKQGGDQLRGHDHRVPVQGEAAVLLLCVHAKRHV